jgi:twitching motility protein PilT
MILDPKLTGQLPEVISEGAYYGMQTFDQHLLQHLHAGRITMEDAMRVATSPHDFKLMVAASAKSVDDGPEAKVSTPPAPSVPTSPEPVHERVSYEPSPPSAPPVEPPSAAPVTVGGSDNGHSAGPPPSAPPPGLSF